MTCFISGTTNQQKFEGSGGVYPRKIFFSTYLLELEKQPKAKVGATCFWRPLAAPLFLTKYFRFIMCTLSVREFWGSIPGPVKSAQCNQLLATGTTFHPSCVALALRRGDGHPATRYTLRHNNASIMKNLI